jgi:hypothetical protein
VFLNFKENLEVASDLETKQNHLFGLQPGCSSDLRRADHFDGKPGKRY